MIETERLVLRPMEEADRAWYNAQSADPVVMRHLGGAQSAEVAARRFDYMRALHATHGFTFWLLEEKRSGQPIGICGLKTVDAPAAPNPGGMEIGWRLSEAWWGKGYAREAATAALDHAFRVVGADRVVAFTHAGNVASWGLMERLGMMRRADMDFHDNRYPPEANPTIVYLIEAQQWMA